MAIELGANPASKTLVITFADWRGQRRTERILLKGTATDNDIVAILTDLDGISNAKVVSAEVVASVKATGFKASATQNVPNENIQEFMALNFSGTNPLNSKKRVYKTVPIPAPMKGIEDSSGSGKAVGNNATLNNLTGNLETNLAYVGADGTTYSGFLAYGGGQHLSGAEVVDNV